jgi:alpha-L-fucosidase 2
MRSCLLLLLLVSTALAELKTDIEFAKVGDVSLTLDANVPDGPGPFPMVILVHGGGWMRGDKLLPDYADELVAWLRNTLK